MSTQVRSYTFDDFLLDLDARTLSFRDQPISITPKAFETLAVLVRNHGKVVEKEHFLTEVWPDAFVEESTLAQNISTLRKAFNRFNSEKEFIVTIPRRGYQFVGNVKTRGKPRQK